MRRGGLWERQGKMTNMGGGVTEGVRRTSRRDGVDFRSVRIRKRVDCAEGEVVADLNTTREM